MTYQELLLRSKFVAVPRGDNLYSYRFTEVLSSGAIPVLFGNDEWILPFRNEIVHWDQCIIYIPEYDILNHTISILSHSMMNHTEICQRRQYCYYIYKTYMETSYHIIHGILHGLETLKQQQQQ